MEICAEDLQCLHQEFREEIHGQRIEDALGHFSVPTALERLAKGLSAQMTEHRVPPTV